MFRVLGICYWVNYVSLEFLVFDSERGGEIRLSKYIEFIRFGCGEKVVIVLVVGCVSIFKRK